MPNDNISFNSIDELQHFRTTEDVYGVNPNSHTLSDTRMADSGHFLTEPVKRESGDVFGPPVISHNEEAISLPPFGDTIIGSIPVITPTNQSSGACTDLIHLNIQHNPSSFAVVPVNTIIIFHLG